MSAEFLETLGTPQAPEQIEAAAKASRRAIATARGLRAALSVLLLSTVLVAIVFFPLGLATVAPGWRWTAAAAFWSVGTLFIFAIAVFLAELLCGSDAGQNLVATCLASPLLAAAAAAMAHLSNQPVAPLAILGLCIGVLLEATVGTCSRLGRAKEYRDGLKALKAEDCPEVLGDCQKDPEAESYRLAVARIKRPLTREEARRLHEWSVQAPSRQQRAERLRQQQVACCLLRSDEPLPADLQQAAGA